MFGCIKSAVEFVAAWEASAPVEGIVRDSATKSFGKSDLESFVFTVMLAYCRILPLVGLRSLLLVEVLALVAVLELVTVTRLVRLVREIESDYGLTGRRYRCRLLYLRRRHRHGEAGSCPNTQSCLHEQGGFPQL